MEQVVSNRLFYRKMVNGRIDYDSLDMDSLIWTKYLKQEAKDSIAAEAKENKQLHEEANTEIVYTDKGAIDYDATDMDNLIQNSFKKQVNAVPHILNVFQSILSL